MLPSRKLPLEKPLEPLASNLGRSIFSGRSLLILPPPPPIPSVPALEIPSPSLRPTELQAIVAACAASFGLAVFHNPSSGDAFDFFGPLSVLSSLLSGEGLRGAFILAALGPNVTFPRLILLDDGSEGSEVAVYAVEIGAIGAIEDVEELELMCVRPRL